MTDNTEDRGRPRGGRPTRGRFDRADDRSPRRIAGGKPPRFGRPDERRAAPAEAQRPTLEAPPELAEERVAKTIARAGVASRRDAEAMIAEGRVTLNGAVLTSPAVNVTAQDHIAVDGEPLPARERTRLWLFHKPRGLVTTARDPEGRQTVFETLPEELPRVVAIGRLDINTEGLLLLTNDGGLAKVIAHPDTGWLRRYKVRAHGEVEQADLDRLRGGVSIEGMDYGPIEASLDRRQGDNVWITLGLREGKNREVKRILEHLGLQVNRLIRLSFGPFQLGDLEPGLVEEVRTKVLKEQLGATLAQAAGVDFESPVREPIAPFGPKKAAPEREPPRARFERSGERFGRKDERFGRSRDGARPRGWDEGGPQRGGRPPRDRDDAPRPAPRPGQPRPTVWRDEDGDAGHRKGHKAPRRGADPKAARAALAERPRERVGAVEGREGRKVVVERLVAAPEADRGPVRRPAKRAAPAGDDRPRRREGFQAPDRARNRDPGRSDAPFRKPRSGPGRERTPGGEDRPARKPGGFRNGRDGGDRPRGAERTGFGKGPRGFGGGPRRGPEGGPGRGSGKGPPRGRRP